MIHRRRSYPTFQRRMMMTTNHRHFLPKMTTMTMSRSCPTCQKMTNYYHRQMASQGHPIIVVAPPPDEIPRLL
jgi:hypothetical protein